MSVESILDRVASGEIPHRSENGWTFVDVAPDGPVVMPVKRQPHERPKTYTVVTVTEEELAALADLPDAAPPAPAASEAVPPSMDAEPEPEPSNFSNWRSARQRTSRTRMAPRRIAAA